MNEIDYQASLFLLDFLVEQELLSSQEAFTISQKLVAQYDPKITKLTGLNQPME